MQYAANGLYATEEEAKTDLDTCGYAGKWGKAKASVNPDLSPAAYWDAVRLYFLELGGCWLAERTTPAPTDEARRVLPIIPAMPYMGGPMKVRQG